MQFMSYQLFSRDIIQKKSDMEDLFILVGQKVFMVRDSCMVNGKGIELELEREGYYGSEDIEVVQGEKSIQFLVIFRIF